MDSQWIPIMSWTLRCEKIPATPGFSSCSFAKPIPSLSVDGKPRLAGRQTSQIWPLKRAQIRSMLRHGKIYCGFRKKQARPLWHGSFKYPPTPAILQQTKEIAFPIQYFLFSNQKTYKSNLYKVCRQFHFYFLMDKISKQAVLKQRIKVVLVLFGEHYSKNMIRHTAQWPALGLSHRSCSWSSTMSRDWVLVRTQIADSEADYCEQVS